MKDMGHNTRFTNLYIKNFSEDVENEALVEMFSKHGSIVSAVVMRDRVGKSLCFGFVSFDDHESAAAVSAAYCVCTAGNNLCVVM